MDHTNVTAAALYRYRVPFRRPFTTSGLSFSEREGLIFELTSSEGDCGLGEASPLPGFSSESIEESLAAAIQVLGPLRGIGLPIDRAALSATMVRLQSKIGLPPSIRFGLESALIELAAKAAGLPVAKWLNPVAEQSVAVNAVISGSDSDSDVADFAASKFFDGYRTFKLKVGGRPSADDLARIEAVRRAVGGEAQIRLDANRGWTYTDALQFLKSVADFGIEFIEEPLLEPRWDGLNRLRDLVAVPIALDESLPAWLADEARKTAPPCFDTAIIKPPVHGGICENLGRVEQLRHLNLRCVVTSFLDTAVGVSASLHLALAARTSGIACGFDTLELLQSPLADHALTIERGLLHLPTAAGFGIALRESNGAYLTRIRHED